MEGGVVDPGVPGLGDDKRRGRNNSFPLLCAEEHGDEEDPGEDEAMDIDEVPDASHSDGMAIGVPTIGVR